MSAELQYVIGKHGQDAEWLHWNGEDWTDNIFAALKVDNNRAVKMVHAMEGIGVKAYTEVVDVAAWRHQAMAEEKVEKTS